MKRFQSILCASLLTVAIASTAFAGNISTLNGNISTLNGNITTQNGNITTRFLTDYIYSMLVTMIW